MLFVVHAKAVNSARSKPPMWGSSQRHTNLERHPALCDGGVGRLPGERCTCFSMSGCRAARDAENDSRGSAVVQRQGRVQLGRRKADSEGQDLELRTTGLWSGVVVEQANRQILRPLFLALHIITPIVITPKGCA
jgi:hypothetical protein